MIVFSSPKSKPSDKYRKIDYDSRKTGFYFIGMLVLCVLVLIAGSLWESIFKGRFVKIIDHLKCIDTIAYNVYTVAIPVGYLNQMRMAGEGLMDKNYFKDKWGHQGDIYTQIPAQYLESGVGVGNSLYANEMLISGLIRNLTSAGLGKIQMLNDQPLDMYVYDLDSQSWKMRHLARAAAIGYQQELANYLYRNPLNETSAPIGVGAGNDFTTEGMTRWNYLNPFLDIYFKCTLFLLISR